MEASLCNLRIILYMDVELNLLIRNSKFIAFQKCDKTKNDENIGSILLSLKISFSDDSDDNISSSYLP